MNKITKNNQTRRIVSVKQFFEAALDRLHPPEREQVPGGALTQLVSKMKIGHREPAFSFVKESESPVEQNVLADGNLARWRSVHGKIGEGSASNYRLPGAASIAIEGAILQMPKCLNLTIAGIAACLVVGCATQSRPTLVSGQRMPNVRTTAYTHTEKGGPHNALGTYLSGRHVMSAASDWSRYPLGTRFRIADTNEEYVIDDYGFALIGTDTIDLYKASRIEMKRWGVRHVDIDILQWGSEEQSLKVLAPRAKHRCARQMIASLQKKRTQSKKELIASLDSKKPQQKKKT